MILFLGTTPAVQRAMTFERLSLDQVNRATSTEVAPAGKSVNAARIAHKLGGQVVATGFIGGETGTLIRRALDTQHVIHDFVTVDTSTRVCVTVIDESTGRVTELIEEPSSVNEQACDLLLDRVRAWVGRCKVAVLSGSLAPGVPVDFYARCMSLMPGDEVKWIIDATGVALEQTLRHKPFVVKPNAGELGATVRMPVETESQVRDAIAALIALGPSWAVVTRGADPVVVSDGNSFWKIRPSHVRPVSPIGAGDALAGALAVGLWQGLAVPQACARATQVASASTLSRLAGEVQDQHLRAVANFVEEF